MSRERRQQRRRQRQRRRRRSTGPSFEPVGTMPMPGVFGWFQRNPRIFYVGGIAVMVLSLGAFFFSTQGGAVAPRQPSDDPAATATAEAATPEPTATPPEEEPIRRVYEAPPPMTIDPSRSYTAVIRTEKGEVRIELLPEQAPGYVNNFVFLARNRFYEGLTFHRVIPGFVAQGGDPTAQGTGGSGYWLPEEQNSLPFDAGALSMAKAGDQVSGSQFFITLEPQPALNDGFTVFGRVVQGMDVLRQLTAREPGRPNQPAGDRILGIEIVEE